MTIQPYLNFNGNCREAVEFYADVFKANKPQIMTFGEMPDGGFPGSEDTKNLVLHADLNVNGNIIIFSDAMPQNPVNIGNNFSLTLITKNIDELKEWFQKLKEGGIVTMELQETFWTKCYGMLIDKFGVGWQFSLEA